jgi:hypothetical protein
VIHHGFRRFLGDMLNAALMVMGLFERFLVGCVVTRSMRNIHVMLA